MISGGSIRLSYLILIMPKLTSFDDAKYRKMYTSKYVLFFVFVANLVQTLVWREDE